jgi:hypothetical protein
MVYIYIKRSAYVIGGMLSSIVEGVLALAGP